MPTRVVQELKKRAAQRILGALLENRQHAWGMRMLGRVRLPPSVHSDSTFRVWQRRFYPFAVHREEKRLEKLNSMHDNPVNRGLVSAPDQWPWSSFRLYHLNDASLLRIDGLT